MTTLKTWGLTAEREEAFRAHREAGRVLGRVVRTRGRSPSVMTEGGELEVRASPDVGPLVVGDWVACDEAGAHVIERMARATEVVRKRPGKASRAQALAANVDVAFVLTGLDDDFSVRRIERYVTIVESGGARPVLLLTKSDLCDDLEARVAEVATVAGTRPVIVTSAIRGEGVDEVRSHLGEGETAVLLGSSGVGKSTLLNALLGDPRVPTGAVMEDGRGRHTTTHRELFLIPGGGIIADVPGLREVGIGGDAAAVESAFDEVAELSTHCRFGDCRHDREPGCAVRAAVASGELSEDRFAAYLTLRAEARSVELRSSEHERRAHEKAHPYVQYRKERRRRGED